MSAGESWSAQRDALAAEVLRRTGRLRLQVRGESMLPTLWPGDIAEIAACSLHDIARGEIVLAFRDGRFFLHRFLSRNHQTFLTRGDSIPNADPAFPSDALLGKLVGVIRNGQTISATRHPSPVVATLFRYCGFARRAALHLNSWRNSGRLPLVDLESA